jgi:uncharacterized protein
VTPIRSCVGCGDRAPQATLIRVTYGEDALRRDGRRRTAGRGAYLHERPACWDAFIARRGPVRSLRSAIPRAVRVRLVEQLHAHAARREG